MSNVGFSYDLGIQTFDTVNVYSNGLSEVILGKAIKQHNLPRDEIVVMTKVRVIILHSTYMFTQIRRCSLLFLLL